MNPTVGHRGCHWTTELMKDQKHNKLLIILANRIDQTHRNLMMSKEHYSDNTQRRDQRKVQVRFDE